MHFSVKARLQDALYDHYLGWHRAAWRDLTRIVEEVVKESDHGPSEDTSDTSVKERKGEADAYSGYSQT